MRRAGVLVGLAMVVACQEDELPPPPIMESNSGGPVVPPMGNATSGDGDTGGPMVTSGITATAGSDDDGSDSGDTGSMGSGTGASVPLLTGTILDGPAGLVPTTCAIRMHLPESIDPGSGLPFDVQYEAVVEVSGLPQPYAVLSPPRGEVAAGDDVYVSAQCDVDGDGLPDNVGAYYPGVPLELVTLPAVMVDLPLDSVF